MRMLRNGRCKSFLSCLLRTCHPATGLIVVSTTSPTGKRTHARKRSCSPCQRSVDYRNTKRPSKCTKKWQNSQLVDCRHYTEEKELNGCRCSCLRWASWRSWTLEPSSATDGKPHYNTYNYYIVMGAFIQGGVSVGDSGSLLLCACSMCDVNCPQRNYFPLFVQSFQINGKARQGWKLWSLLPMSAIYRLNQQVITLLFIFTVQVHVH